MKNLSGKAKYLLFPALMCLSLFVRGQETANHEEGLLDFWVGTWEVTWDEGEGKTGHGINKITKVLDGKVIQENFEIMDGQSKGYKGMSLSTYHSVAKKWFQSYVDNNGIYYHFKGDLVGDRKIFKTDVFKTKDGRDFTQRMVFHDITESSLIWEWEYSNDGGKTWNLNWKIDYKRKS